MEGVREGGKEGKIPTKETRGKGNVRWAGREERSTVTRSQMLLISCVAAVRVAAMATVSHSASKQRGGPINPGASVAASLLRP